MKWSDYFEYDESSPSFLRWRVTRYRGRSYKQIAILAGEVAGSLHTDEDGAKYWKVKLNNKQYPVHAVIYEMFNTRINEKSKIDHIDGDSKNNQKSNLREVDNFISARNRKALLNGGETGVNGITKEKQRFRATWYNLSGKRESESFSINKHGEETAFRFACETRDSEIVKLNKLGAGYTERHGK